MLTLLAFVILIGIVADNAIRILDQTRYLIREKGMAQDGALVKATGNHIRPIFLFALTSAAIVFRGCVVDG